MISDEELLEMRGVCHPVKDRALRQVLEDLVELRSNMRDVLYSATLKTMDVEGGERPTYSDKHFRRLAAYILKDALP